MRSGAGWRRLGVTGLLVPEDYDGAGMTMVEAGVVAEELGAALYPGPWLSSAVAATRALVRTGADKDAAGLLTGIAARVHDRHGRPAGRSAADGDRDGATSARQRSPACPTPRADVVLVFADGTRRRRAVLRRHVVGGLWR